MGKALHYLQDTNTPSHGTRDSETGQITAFYDYAKQSPYLHKLGDKPEIGGSVFNNAVDQTSVMIRLFLAGNAEGIPAFFELAPKADIGIAGEDYGPRQ